MKKTFAVLFVLIFLLSLGNLPVQAQAQAKTQPTSFAYIALISPKEKTSIPVEFRALQVFEDLAPRLLEAQAKGQVARFEPEFSYGLLKVEYRTGFDLASRLAVIPGFNLPVFDNPQSVLAYIQLNHSLRSSSLRDADANPTFYLGNYNSCFTGVNLGAENYYKAYLKDTSGRLVSSIDGYSGDDGWMSNCFSDGIWVNMVPDYNFSLKLFDHAGIKLLNTYSTAITRFTISSITISAKTIKGKGPANSKLNFDIGRRALDAGDNWIDNEFEITSTSKGIWSIKLDSSIAMRGRDYIEVGWAKPGTNFFIFRGLYAPFIVCIQGGSTCEISGIPGKSAMLSLTHGKKTYKFAGRFSTDGYFMVALNDASGDPIFVAAGDKVSGTGVKAWTIQTITAAPNYTADTVTGLVPANRYFSVNLYNYNKSTSQWNVWRDWIGSDGTGNYSADFSGVVDIKPTDRLQIRVYYIDPVTGNQTDYENYIAP